MLAIKTCKEQLKEKDDRIQRLTDQYKQYRQQSQREAQLMSSAIYEVRFHKQLPGVLISGADSLLCFRVRFLYMLICG